MILSKTIKIALNYGIGIIISALLLWLLWRQSNGRIYAIRYLDWWKPETRMFGIAALLLLPVNMLLESRKWQVLVRNTVPLTLMQALGSVLTGIAFSMITPNRIGEYPGRMLALRKDFTPRMVSVSVLGATAQLMAILSGGIIGLWYYQQLAGKWPLIVWMLNLLVISLIGAFYFSFSKWAYLIERIKWLKKLSRYGALLRNVSRRLQWTVLGLSLLRFSVFTLQYYLALRWMGLALPPVEGMALCALFFWAMAIIPSISLAETGIRAEVSWQIFQQYGGDAGVVFTATMMLWLVNLIVPAAIGALMLLRVRYLSRD